MSSLNTFMSSSHVRSALAVCAAALATSAAQAAPVYNWVTWNFLTPQASTANTSLGTMSVVTNPTQTVLPNFGIKFDNVAFTPVNAQSAAVTSGFSNTPWNFVVNFTGVANTAGVVVGLGNFGYGPGYPGYRLTAYDKSGNVMSLTQLGIIGSCDHTWTSTGNQFNDNLALNTSNGNFTVTQVAGLNQNNSDILLMTMPSNLGWLDVSTLGPSNGDTINVVIAVPAPGAASLAGMCGLLATRRRRRN
jgi:hypothetical protein